MFFTAHRNGEMSLGFTFPIYLPLAVQQNCLCGSHARPDDYDTSKKGLYNHLSFPKKNILRGMEILTKVKVFCLPQTYQNLTSYSAASIAVGI